MWRLELQVRASLAEREASTRAVRKAEATLAELAAASHEARARPSRPAPRPAPP